MVGRKSHSTIGLCRQTVQKSSVDRRHADLHRFRFGRFEAQQLLVVARVPLHLMPNDANHRQFRRLKSTQRETGRVILQNSGYQ